MNEIVLSLSEDAWNGDAQCRVLVDDNPVGGVVTVNAKHGFGVQSVVVQAELDPGPHMLAVEFLNDGYGGKPELDRNLYFEAATVDARPVNMMPVRLNVNGKSPPVGFLVREPVFDVKGAMAELRLAMDARFDQMLAAMPTGGGAPPPPPPAYAGPMLDRLFVGPQHIFKEIADAIPWANAGAIVLVEDGVYKEVFDCAVLGITIASKSGDPYACWCDGEGLTGGGKRGAWEKSFMHFRAAFTVIGIGGRNCGGIKSDRNHTNEAFIYAESFDAPGVARMVNCAADNCGNGWFVPGAKNDDGTPGPGAGVHWEDEGCVMGKLAPNGQSAPDGSASHDSYVQGASVKVVRRVSLGANGHGVKSRAEDTEILDSYFLCGDGRTVEGPDGGRFAVRRSVLCSQAGRSSNFLGWCSESQKNGGTVATIEDSLLVLARVPSRLHIGAGTTVNLVRSQVRYVGDAMTEVLLGGALNGVPAERELVDVLPKPPFPTYVPFTLPA